MKICRICKKKKQKSDFYKSRAVCKHCRNQQVNNWNKLNHDKSKRIKIESYHRRKRGDPIKRTQKDRGDGFSKTQRRYEKKFPKIRRARGAVQRALKKGKLRTPRNCCINNENCWGEIHAHHCDYNKPLDVMWLCEQHHAKWHRIFKAIGHG